ncbi:BON domain-containing protein [Actinoplanes solisilvae]|uniref:BON domain-containing protein n=1 Tax=Actinoplanes solisilvae TaxID=2486853 RepID=UPI0013E3DC01|nr:BON domain-containing protein [Actinoplanes solisilvae]
MIVELNADERTRHEPIRVSVQNDVVMLAGRVRTPAARDAAAGIVRAIPAANDVCVALSVRTRALARHDRDDFVQIVAGLEPPAPRRRRRPSRMLALVNVAVLILVWLVLPVLTVIVGLPALPMLIAALMVTTGVIYTRPG